MFPRRPWDRAIADLAPLLEAGRAFIVDGGNSHYVDDVRRAGQLARRGLHYVDVGVSGGVWGLDNGYCQMIGGETDGGRAAHAALRGARAGRDCGPRSRRTAARAANG